MYPSSLMMNQRLHLTLNLTPTVSSPLLEHASRLPRLKRTGQILSHLKQVLASGAGLKPN